MFQFLLFVVRSIRGQNKTPKKLKQIETFNIPAVALTADAIQGKSNKYLEVGFNDYFDEHTESGIVTWYPTVLQKMDKVDYMGTILTNVYGLSIPFGYEMDDSNANPDNVEYNWGDKIEFKLESDNMKSFFNIIPYTNITFKQKTTF